MPREFKTIFRLVREGHISDKEAFKLAWALFIAMSGFKAQEDENCCPEATEYREVKGFVGER